MDTISVIRIAHCFASARKNRILYSSNEKEKGNSSIQYLYDELIAAKCCLFMGKYIAEYYREL